MLPLDNGVHDGRAVDGDESSPPSTALQENTVEVGPAELGSRSTG